MKKLLLFLSLSILLSNFVYSQIDSLYYHDSQFESQWGSSTGNDLFRLYVRFTPSTYPATLKGVRCWFRNVPAGATFKWTVYTDATGAANGGVNSVYMSSAAIANPAAGGVTDSAYMAYIDLTSANLIINSGDFYCGVSEANNNGFLGLAIDNAPATSAYNDRQWQYLFGNWSTMINNACPGQFGVTAFFDAQSMNVEEQSSSSITVFPNPSTDKVTVSVPENFVNGGTIRIVNDLGETVYASAIERPDMQIDLSAYESGIYFISIQNQDQTITQRLLRQ